MAFCSNCGASLDNMTGTSCPYCGAQFVSDPNWQQQNQQNNGYQQNNWDRQNNGYQQNNWDRQNNGYQQNDWNRQNNGYQQNYGNQQNNGYQQNYGNQQNFEYQRNNGYPPAARGTNGMCIAGFICAFLIPILGLIFSIIGVSQVKKTGAGGRGLGIAGIVISIAMWVISFIILMT